MDHYIDKNKQIAGCRLSISLTKRDIVHQECMLIVSLIKRKTSFTIKAMREIYIKAVLNGRYASLLTLPFTISFEWSCRTISALSLEEKE
jgi:hypothetical protein